MVTSPNISGMKITNYYKYILYVAGVILILSFFVEAPEGMSNFKIRNTAFWIIVAGIIIWAYDVYVFKLFAEIFFDNRSLNNDYFWTNYIIFLIIQAVIWIFVWFELISPIL